jgi:hypothetical protein
VTPAPGFTFGPLVGDAPRQHEALSDRVAPLPSIEPQGLGTSDSTESEHAAPGRIRPNRIWPSESMVSHTWNWLDFGRQGEGVAASIEIAALKVM